VSYYQGDFYQGDPGFFGSLGKVFRGVASSVAGFIPGVGPVASKVLAKLPGGAGGALARVGGAIIKHPVLSAAGAAGTIGVAGMVARGAPMGMGMGAGGVAPRGFHHCKSKRGCRGGVFVRNRRMNPCNGRALKRAIRRAHAFERIAKHVIGFSSPRKPKGHMYFKRKRKSK
jgi:hypothetical protein